MPARAKSVLIWLFWIFVIYSIVTSPDRSADIARNAWDILFTGVQNLARFFTQLLGRA